MDNELVTIREVYQLIDQKVGAIEKSILRLENKFDTLEAGRLSALETKFADFKGNVQGRMAMLSGIIALVGTFIGIIVGHIWR